MEEKFICQDCGHHEYSLAWIGDPEDDRYGDEEGFECLNCYNIQNSLSGEREEE